MVVPDTQPLREEGLRLLQSGDLDASIERLKEALEADPNDAKALIYLGAAHAQKGDMEQAIPAFELAAQIHPTHKFLYNLGLAYEEVGRIAAAQAAYARALDVNPDYTPAVEAAERIGPPPEPVPARPLTLRHAQDGGLGVAQDRGMGVVQSGGMDSAQVDGFEEPLIAMEGTAEPAEAIVEQPAESQPLYPDAHSLHRAMIKSGLVFGALIGIVWMAVMFLLPLLVLPDGLSSFGSPLELLPIIVAIGLIVGAVTGFLAGLTGGGSETGLKIGVVIGLIAGIFFVVAGGAAGTAILLVALIGVLAGALGGYLIGYAADSSIARRLPG